MTEPLRKPSLDAPIDILPGAAPLKASEPGHSVWVAASAGSGKTDLLARRVLRLLLSGVNPSRILCLTFTRAAAAEMAIRVTERLGVWATCSLDELRAELDRLQGEAPKPAQLIEARRLLNRTLNCPGGLRIRTIHAFGQEILRRFPLEAGLPPHFAVIEERDAAEIRKEALRGLMRDAAASPNSELSGSLSMLAATLGDGGLQDALGGILKDRARLLAATAKGVDDLKARIRSQLSLEPGDTAESICAETLTHVPSDDLRPAAQKLLTGAATYKARGEGLLQFLLSSPAERLARFDDYCGFFLTQKGEPFANPAGEKLDKAHPGLNDILRREAQRLVSAKARLEAVEIFEGSASLITLGLDLLKRTDVLKSGRAALDYDDLIMHADALLRRPGIAPWVLYKLDGGLDHILVDEAQDTSAAQWRIVAALAEEFFVGDSSRGEKPRTLFVVGDEKQSIFSFQNADPEAFNHMRSIFSRRAMDAGKSWREEKLSFSFRSAPAVLRAVDAVFALDEARAGVADEPIRHFPAPPRLGDAPKLGRIELWPLIAAPEKTDREAWSLPGDYDLERDREAELAANIAAKIKGFIDRRETLPGQSRPIMPGDIMILLRRRGRFADLMVRALKANRVDVTGVDRMRLVKQLPVMDLLALLQFALLPEDDLNLASLLRSPLLGLSEGDLMQLCIKRKGALWQSLRDAEKIFQPAHDYLVAILARADFTAPFAFLSAALSEPCPGGASGRRALWSRLGVDALDPIEELLSAALDFGMKHPPSLQEFLRWLTAGDTEIKRELDKGSAEDGGQVRIMTVHAAKGLEAPIVFLPDAAGLPRAQDVPEILWNDNTPFYLPRRPMAGLPRRLWENARQKQMEEYRRLFYVALTRASHRLYIAGWEPSRNEGRGERLRPKGAQSETGMSGEQSWHALALKALQPLHEPHAITHDDKTPPLVAFEDPVLGIDAKPAKEIKKPETQKLPLWASSPAPQIIEAKRPLSPSTFVATPATATPDAVFTRGRIIHRLLQSLPDVAEGQRAQIAIRFLANPQHGLTEAQQKTIADEVLKLLATPEYAPLFGSNSRAEVPLVGRIEGQPFSGQIDRLCVREQDIWIVDYKTGTPPNNAAEIPLPYRNQLAAYRALLRQIYPGKEIRGFLLWTGGPTLQEVTDFS